MHSWWRGPKAAAPSVTSMSRQARTARTVTSLTSTLSGAERQKRTAATTSCACSAAAAGCCWPPPAAAARAPAGAAAAAAGGAAAGELAGVLFPAAPVRKDQVCSAAGDIVLTRSGTPRTAASSLRSSGRQEGVWRDQRLPNCGTMLPGAIGQLQRQHWRPSPPRTLQVLKGEWGGTQAAHEERQNPQPRRART